MHILLFFFIHYFFLFILCNVYIMHFDSIHSPVPLQPPHPCIHPPLPHKMKQNLREELERKKQGKKWKSSSRKLQCDTANQAVNPFVHVRSPFIIVAYTKQLTKYYSKYLLNIIDISIYIWIYRELITHRNTYIHAQFSLDVLIRLLSVINSVSYILPRPVHLPEFVSVSRTIFLVCHRR